LLSSEQKLVKARHRHQAAQNTPWLQRFLLAFGFGKKTSMVLHCSSEVEDLCALANLP